jgi:hypothetical protein
MDTGGMGTQEFADGPIRDCAEKLVLLHLQRLCSKIYPQG